MSRTTSEAEYYVTCGFFNSDATSARKYDAQDFSKLFDGMVTDGVFASIGDCLVVKAASGNTVNIGTGKCWFNHTWTLNSDILPMVCDPADTLLNRIDAIVLEVNSTQSVRDNCFKYIKGTPSLASEPLKPALINTEFVHQHALCYINRPLGSTEITQANIENVVGTSETPFITALLQTVSLDELLGQWQAQLDEFIAARQDQLDGFIAARQADVNTFVSDNERRYDESIDAKERAADDSIAAKEAAFDEAIATKEAIHNAWSSEIRTEMESLLAEVELWYGNTHTTVDEYLAKIKDKLATDPAISLQLQIGENEIKDILMNGFVDGTQTISPDGSVISSVNSSGWTLVRTFTNNFLTLTSVLTDSNNTELGRLVKNFSSDGLTIASEFTLL